MDNNECAAGGFLYPRIYSHNTKLVREAFCRGEIDYAELTKWNFTDEFFCYLLNSKFFVHADNTYPNPRERNTVPIWFLISAQLILRLYSGKYHQLKYLLNSGSILTRLGFNISNIEGDGFNIKNKNPRTTVADSDAIRRFFKDTQPLSLRAWYNHEIQSWFKSKRCYDSKGIFILDQSHLVVPDNPNYKGAVKMPVDEHGQWYSNYKNLTNEQKKSLPMHNCYTCSTLLHIDGERDYFHIAGYEFGPGNEDELVQARKIIVKFCEQYSGAMKLLIVDRGYIDGQLIGQLKNEYGVDVLIPLKSSMDTYKDAIGIAQRTGQWANTEFQARANGELIKETKTASVNDMDLWPECPVKLNTYVSFTKRWSNSRQKYDEYYWVLASTKKNSAQDAVNQYGLRFQVEERFRQLKLSWGINKFSSPAEGLIEAHICFTFMTYSLLQLYLRREELQEQTNQMLHTLQGSEKTGKNAVVVYTGDNYGVLDLDYCFLTIASMEDIPRKKIQEIMAKQMEARLSKID